MSEGTTPTKEIPKPWDHSIEYVSAPSKPGEDPWKVILDPLMQRDKLQCNAWKEEVQNLLIFAGLFSAVVTGFAIESYKNLQPNSDSNLFSALVHIAARLDNPSDPGLGTFANQAPPPFSPTASAIRVNIFWFLSLVLSLTTVLVGIISLQWLREYQSYPNFSPRETLALFHMRSDGFKQWHVGTIFTALPLLLQAALVLFFGGTIDFLLDLDKEVATPVTVVIGLALFFLIATTMLPSLQSFILYISLMFFRRPSLPPSQCPYKSPQSWAFHRIYYLFSVLRHSLCFRKRSSPSSPTFSPDSPGFFFSTPKLFFRSLKKRIVRMLFLHGLRRQGSVAGDLFSDIAVASGTTGNDLDTPTRTRRSSRSGFSHYHAVPEPPLHQRIYNSIRNFIQTWPHSINNHVLSHISTTWRNKTWIDYDLTWLLIRNSCQIGIHDHRPNLEEHYLFLNDNLPLYDISKVLQDFLLGKDRRRVHHDSAYPVVYHCFRDLASSFLSVESKSLWANSYYITPYHLEDIQISWNYLDSLLFDVDKPDPPIMFAKVVADSQDDSYRTFNHTLHNLHLLVFFSNIENHFTSRTVLMIKEHSTEAHIRLMRTFYGAHGAYHSAGINKALPRYCRNLNLEIVLNNEGLFWQCLNVFIDYFKFITQINATDVEHFPDNLLHDHPRVKFFLWDAAAYINFMVRSSTFHKFQHTAAMETAVIEMLQNIAEHLQDDLEAINENYFGQQRTLTGDPEHIDLFYTTSVFSEQVIRYLQKPRMGDPNARRPKPHIYHQFAKLFHVMRDYKKYIVDVRGINLRLQEQFEAHGAWERPCDFSTISWWSFLDYFPTPSQNFAKLEPLLGYDDRQFASSAPPAPAPSSAPSAPASRPQISHPAQTFSAESSGTRDSSNNVLPDDDNPTRRIRIDPKPVVVGDDSGAGAISREQQQRHRRRTLSTVASNNTNTNSSSYPTSPATAMSGTSGMTSNASTEMTAIVPATATDTTPTEPELHSPDPKFYTVTIYEPTVVPPNSGVGPGPNRSALRNPSIRQNSKDTDRSPGSMASLSITDSPLPRRPVRKAVPTFVPADILEEPLDAGRTIRVYEPESAENSPTEVRKERHGGASHAGGPQKNR